MTYSPMDFRAGSVVLYKPNYDAETKIGHVVGFTRNAIGEVILEVRWDSGETGSVHPNLVTLDPANWPPRWSEAKCLERLRRDSEQTGVQESEQRGLFARLFG